MGVLFADVRGYTTLAERIPVSELASLMNRFDAAATDVLAHHDAVIDKLLGDEVMALFIRGFAGPAYIEEMIQSAEALLKRVGFGPGGSWLPLGVGLDFGSAFVGNVSTGEVKDFTALGDVVNTAARLQAEAKPGQIVMSQRVWEMAADTYPGARSVRFELKGKSEPVDARVVDLNRAEAPV